MGEVEIKKTVGETSTIAFASEVGSGWIRWVCSLSQIQFGDRSIFERCWLDRLLSLLRSGRL